MSNETIEADHVVSTLPLPLLRSLADDELAARLPTVRLPYQGVVNALFFLRTPLAGHYWTPVMRSGTDFDGVVEMSTLTGTESRAGLHLAYAMRYTDRESELYRTTMPASPPGGPPSCATSTPSLTTPSRTSGSSRRRSWSPCTRWGTWHSDRPSGCGAPRYCWRRPHTSTRRSPAGTPVFGSPTRSREWCRTRRGGGPSAYTATPGSPARIAIWGKILRHGKESRAHRLDRHRPSFSAAIRVPRTLASILAKAISREVDVSSANGENPQSSHVPSRWTGM